MTISAMTSAPLRDSAGIEELLGASLGLRERKKLKTRRAIRAAAFRRFAEQGYEATTIDQIAGDADISPSTFFRYFPTKEDLVIRDDYDPLLESALRARPANESLVESIRHAMMEPLREIIAVDHDDMLTRMRILIDNPVVNARNQAEMHRTRDMLLNVFCERNGRSPEDLELRVQIAAFLAATFETILYWAQRDGQDDIVTLLEQALDAVAKGFNH